MHILERGKGALAGEVGSGAAVRRAGWDKLLQCPQLGIHPRYLPWGSVSSDSEGNQVLEMSPNINICQRERGMDPVLSNATEQNHD